MRRACRGISLSLAMVFTLLGGCIDEDGPASLSFVVHPLGEGMFLFSTEFDADNYTWSFGDRTPPAYGSSAEHAYDFSDGTVTASLRVVSGGVTHSISQPLVLGTGMNQEPRIQMFASTDWAIVGEPVSIWLAVEDSDGGKPRTQWSCIRVDTSVRLVPHNETVVEPRRVATAQTREEPLEEIRDIQGDMCSALERPNGQHDLALRGVFSAPGLYQVVVSVSDGPHPADSHLAEILVSRASDRVPEFMTWTFSNEHGPGTNGTLDAVDPAFTHAVEAPVRFLELSATATAIEGDAGYYLRLTHQGAKVAEGPDVRQANLSAGAYSLHVQHKGLPGTYLVEVDARIDVAEARRLAATSAP